MQPAPFEINRDDDKIIASDGSTAVVVHGEGVIERAEVCRSRAISGVRAKPVAEQLIPMLNAFATELLSDASIDDEAAGNRLRSMANMVKLPEPQHHEALSVRIDGIDVRVSAGLVVITNRS